ncbi:hypothetical protein QUF58_04605 [Anaerolineales bacterium HSG24]|nr:hypothetical protein [Anaerolineales bacterium HSG24]
MQKQVSMQHIDYTQAISEQIANMPVELVMQVYDFVCFLQARPAHTLLIEPDTDWLNDTEEQIQTEDALWDAAHTQHRNKFAALAEAARSEIETGATQPMFNEYDELVI